MKARIAEFSDWPSVAQDSKVFGIRRQHAVLDAVVNHLHEVTGIAWTAVEFRPLRDR